MRVAATEISGAARRPCNRPSRRARLRGHRRSRRSRAYGRRWCEDERGYHRPRAPRTRWSRSRRVSRSDDLVLLLVSGDPVDLVSSNAVLDATIRSLDEAVLVHAGVQRERTDQADVGAFGGLDGAHTGVVRVVDVADGRRRVGTTAGTGLVAGKTAGAEGRPTALVRQTGQRVGLVHELGELRRAEELLDGRHDRTDVDQALRRDLVDVLRAHTLANHALHAVPYRCGTGWQQARRPYGYDGCRSGRYRPVLKPGVPAASELEEVAQRGDDVLIGQHPTTSSAVSRPSFLFDLVATHARQVVTLRVEEQALEEAARSVDGRGLARTQATIDLDKSILARKGGIALDGTLDDVESHRASR